MADGEPLDWKLKLLAWVNLGVGGIGLGLGLLLILGSLQPPYSETILPWLGPLLIGVSLVWFIPAVLTGWGLLARKWWAPGMVVIGSLMQLLIVPVGTIIGAFGLYAVFRNPTKLLEAGERDMRRVDMAENLKVALRAGVIGLVAIATLGAIIGLGYIFRDQVEQLPPVRGPFGVAIFVVGLALFMLVARIMGWTGGSAITPGSIMRSAKGRRETAKAVTDHNVRMARLEADPATVKYARMIKSGDYWSDDQIAYDRNPDAKATCQHLNYIEQAMRQARVLVKPVAEKHVQAACLVDWPELSRRLGRQTQVTFDADVFQGDRGVPDEWAESVIRCLGCQAGIHTVHARDARPDTPRFPVASLTSASEPE